MLELDCNLDASQMAPNVPLSSFRLELTPKEIARLVFALEHTIDSFGDVFTGTELSRYEDLAYRLQGLPDSCISMHAEQRLHDRG